MTKEDRRILGLFANRVRARFPHARILAYGSRTRGDAAVDSDMDVCVIVTPLDRTIAKEIDRIAWEVGFENDLMISALEFEEASFERKAKGQHPLVSNILKDGIAA
jgi:predicted nucleotidyltransferase